MNAKTPKAKGLNRMSFRWTAREGPTGARRPFRITLPSHTDRSPARQEAGCAAFSTALSNALSNARSVALSVAPSAAFSIVLAACFLPMQAEAGLKTKSTGTSNATATTKGKSDGPTLVSIEGIETAGLRKSLFVLPTDTEVTVRSEGAADRKRKHFLAYGWILDLDTREPVWTMNEAPGEFDRDTDNWISTETIPLPAGRYAAYFSALGGNFPFDASIKIWGLELGEIKSEFGPFREWDDIGEPESWGIEVRAVDRAYRAGNPPIEQPEPFADAPVRALGLGNRERIRLRVALDRPIEFNVWATGEFSEARGDFVDASWIVDADTWRHVWTLDREDTEPAGGSDKNRLFRGRVRLAKGAYFVNAVTDDSHATDDWNSPPPWDPDSWGIAMTPIAPADRGAVHVGSASEALAAAVVIREVGSDEAVCKPFRVTQPAAILVRALGEESGNEFADFGWIEDRTEFETVWMMDTVETFPAGGAAKNRLVESVVQLPAGFYNLCYKTDDSHAYGDWNAEEPDDPEDWGISIAELAGSSHVVEGAAGFEAPVLSITPAESGEHVVRRFASDGSTRIRIIAIGEGVGHEMADYGWLENSDTGETVWEMEYEDTKWAGGAKKNREARVTLTLPEGRYELHFKTDDSHAWGDWNASMPRQPQMYGITLIEVR